MFLSRLSLLVSLLIFVGTSYAMSPEALEGKAFYAACDVCHNQEIDPPLGPPMWGVQRRYKNGTLDNEDFVDSMVDFVKAPEIEAVKHDEAFKQLGLMRPMPLPDDMLKNISAYIMEETFPPPCDHWQIAVKRATERGDPEHAKKDQNMFNRYCK
ncbi:MAG: hypothetical protein ABW148_02505 [Sedimenticola sp.]